MKNFFLKCLFFIYFFPKNDILYILLFSINIIMIIIFFIYLIARNKTYFTDLNNITLLDEYIISMNWAVQCRILNSFLFFFFIKIFIIIIITN